MLKRCLKILMICALALGVSGCISVDLRSLLAPEMKEIVVEEGSRRKIALVPIEGFISSKSDAFLGSIANANPTALKATLNRLEDDRAVCALVLRINSPGGEVTASDVMYHEIRQFKKRTGIPVFASIGGMGCSGAYYIACAADEIYVQPTSVSGSIGVIARFPQLKGLGDKIGYDQVIVKSGDMKALGDPMESMRPEERVIIQQTIDSMYGRFVRVVADARPELDEAGVRAIADGRVYTPEEATTKKLADGIAYLDGVIDKARQVTGKHRARVIQYSYDDHEDMNVYSSATKPAPQVNVSLVDLNASQLLGQHGFLYLWMPTQ